MAKYGAIRSVVNSGKFLVAELDLYNRGVTDVLGEFGFIDSYKEADELAKRIAKGEFPGLPAGEYISIRER